ncbi:hypothetical protein Amac_037260 [Acrocarpospora macrocephala]|uniref:Uncharacterized protein n=1 Tax=Acrocarpospora macrocephala TaxID=150177 RepID=A0A5M3WPL8_9ACTN|nr:hypothetical protein Amac_037260 [Acrocarpospora macrocephala]
MEVEAAELGLRERFAPCPGEVRPPQLGALRADEHQALIPLPRVRVQVHAQVGQKEFGDGDDALAGPLPLRGGSFAVGRWQTGWTGIDVRSARGSLSKIIVVQY